MIGEIVLLTIYGFVCYKVANSPPNPIFEDEESYFPIAYSLLN
jgi:hypothetical protein|tara:strand:+ start:68 stop:196 length:129 start_codon:yes stop_codon:yes gene_type:complete